MRRTHKKEQYRSCFHIHRAQHPRACCSLRLSRAPGDFNLLLHCVEARQRGIRQLLRVPERAIYHIDVHARVFVLEGAQLPAIFVTSCAHALFRRPLIDLIGFHGEGRVGRTLRQWRQRRSCALGGERVQCRIMQCSRWRA